MANPVSGSGAVGQDECVSYDWQNVEIQSRNGARIVCGWSVIASFIAAIVATLFMYNMDPLSWIFAALFYMLAAFLFLSGIDGFLRRYNSLRLAITAKQEKILAQRIVKIGPAGTAIAEEVRRLLDQQGGILRFQFARLTDDLQLCKEKADASQARAELIEAVRVDCDT